MSENETPFADTIRRFHEAGVRFVVIGGVALGLHGSDYVTTDTDFADAVDSENVERLAAFLTVIHARILGRPASDGFVITPQTLERVRFLNLSTYLGFVDVVREIPGLESFEGLWARAIPMDSRRHVLPARSVGTLPLSSFTAHWPVPARLLCRKLPRSRPLFALA